MRAVDTNILVRLIVGDDPLQSALAHSLVAKGPIWVSRTVILETNWVLRNVLGLSASEVASSLLNVLGLSNVDVESRPAVESAISLTQQGIDFADALHLTSTPPGVPFVTFDKTFVRRAKRAGVTGISELLPAN